MDVFFLDLGLRGFGPQLLTGLVLSLQLWLVALCLGTALGIVGALGRLSTSKATKALSATYVNVLRGIPDLLVIMLLYYCGSVTISWFAGRYVELSAFASGTLSLALVFGAYSTEIFRGAIMAVPPGQQEASLSLGLGRTRTFLLVTLPQAWRFALPAFGNQSVVLVKQTSLVSIIGLEELMRKGKIAVNATNEPFTFYATIGLMYLAITLCLTFALRVAEKSAARGHVRS